MLSRQRFLLLLLAGSAVVGCSTSLSDGGTPLPSNTQFSELSRSFEDELESGVPDLGVLTPGLPPSFPASAGCPTLSSLTDTDGDGVYDDATFTYTNPPCQATGFGGGTLAVTGAVRLQDLSASDSSSYRLTLTNLTWQFTDPGATLSYTSVRNGVRIRGDSSGVTTLVVNDTTKRQRPQITAVATIAKSLNWAFTPAQGDSVTVNQPLPSGTLTVDGTWHWTRSTEDWNLAVATLTPLSYDASCTTTPQRIKAGKVTMTGTIAGVNGTLLLQWSACGVAPTRSFTAAP